MTVEMPVLVIHDVYILKKKRLNKRREKIKRNKLKPIPYKSLIGLIFQILLRLSRLSAMPAPPQKWLFWMRIRRTNRGL